MLPAALGGVGQEQLNNNFPPQKNLGEAQAGGQKGSGWGEGIFARLLCPPKAGWGWGKRFRNSSVKRKTKQKNFRFLNWKKFGDAQLKNVKKIFLFCSTKQSGGGRKRWAGLSPVGRQSKVSVRILGEIGSDFVQKVPPIFKIRILGDCCLALASLGLGRNKDFIRIFEIRKQFLPAQTEVRFAEGKHKFEKFINQSFSFAFGERQSDNLILTAK